MKKQNGVSTRKYVTELAGLVFILAAMLPSLISVEVDRFVFFDDEGIYF